MNWTQWFAILRSLLDIGNGPLLRDSTDRILTGSKRVIKDAPSDKSCPPVLREVLNSYADSTVKGRFEEEYVHDVYDRIATHFSHTR